MCPNVHQNPLIVQTFRIEIRQCFLVFRPFHHVDSKLQLSTVTCHYIHVTRKNSILSLSIEQHPKCIRSRVIPHKIFIWRPGLPAVRRTNIMCMDSVFSTMKATAVRNTDLLFWSGSLSITLSCCSSSFIVTWCVQHYKFYVIYKLNPVELREQIDLRHLDVFCHYSSYSISPKSGDCRTTLLTK